MRTSQDAWLIWRTVTGWKYGAAGFEEPCASPTGPMPESASWAATYSAADSRPRPPSPRPSKAGDASKAMCDARASARRPPMARITGASSGTTGPEAMKSAETGRAGG